MHWILTWWYGLQLISIAFMFLFTWFVCSIGEPVMQVKAQVMMRDDSSGGWVPVSGGGMSLVSLLRRGRSPTGVDIISDVRDSDDAREYIILGRRITDDAVCTYM